jgi:uncharacterized membrane protein
VGLAVSIYLTLLHYDSDVPLVCSAGSLVDCATVLSSPSSIVMGIPVAVWGLCWFVVSVAIAILFLRRSPDTNAFGLHIAALGWTLVGTATVLWLVYQEIGVVGRLCAWCTAVHVLVLGLLVIEVERADAALRIR